MYPAEIKQTGEGDKSRTVETARIRDLAKGPVGAAPLGPPHPAESGWMLAAWLRDSVPQLRVSAGRVE